MGTRLTGKVAIVTGSGQGIGRAIAIAFAREGAAVVIATRTATHGEETLRLVEAEGGKAIFRRVDVADHAATRTMVDEFTAIFGRLDVMVHNAAAFGRCTIEEMDQATLDRLFNVNVKACFTLAQASIPHMRKQGAGRIIVTSSVPSEGLDAGLWCLCRVQGCGHRLYPHGCYRTRRGQHHRECR